VANQGVAQQAVADEDSLPGKQSAVAAGIATVGNLVFVPPAERDTRRAGLGSAAALLPMDGFHLAGAELLRLGRRPGPADGRTMTFRRPGPGKRARNSPTDPTGRRS
jgi:hypothetical protein